MQVAIQNKIEKPFVALLKEKGNMPTSENKKMFKLRGMRFGVYIYL